MARVQRHGSVCWVGAPDDVHGPVCAEPGQELRELRRVEPVQRGVRSRELDEVTPTGREMQFSPVDGDGPEAVSQPAKSHPPQQRTRTYVDPGYLEFSIRSGHQEDIRDPGEAAADKVDDLGVQDVPGKQQFLILQVWVWRCGVHREPHSVDRNTHLLVVVGLHQPPTQQVTDAATAADTKPMDIGMRNVVQDRHIDDPTDPNAVGAADRPPEETAQKHRRIGDQVNTHPDRRRRR
jgi:hypothetical protein